MFSPVLVWAQIYSCYQPQAFAGNFRSEVRCSDSCCSALMLSAYDYDLAHRRSEEHLNADVLSRLPCQNSSIAMEGEVYTLGAVREDFPIMALDIAQATLKDPLLCKVHQYTMNGWLKPFHNWRYELSCEQGCVLWGIRAVPTVLRGCLLSKLHWEHPGICSMKAIARSFR